MVGGNFRCKVIFQNKQNNINATKQKIKELMQNLFFEAIFFMFYNGTIKVGKQKACSWVSVLQVFIYISRAVITKPMAYKTLGTDESISLDNIICFITRFQPLCTLAFFPSDFTRFCPYYTLIHLDKFLPFTLTHSLTHTFLLFTMWQFFLSFSL